MNNLSNISKKGFYLTVFLFLFFVESYSQSTTIEKQNQDLRFDQISLEQGLSQSTVNSIVQDEQGFMWFGTQDGLNRYDGYSIKVYKHNPKDSNSIAENRINCLLSDSNGDLWIGTANGGVDRYSLTDEKFYHYIHKENDSLSISNNTVTAIYEDSEHNIWIGTHSGLNRYNIKKQTFQHFYFDQRNPLTLNGNSITAICEDKANNTWVGTYKGLLKYNLNGNHNFIKVNGLNSNPATAYGDYVTSLFIDRKGTLWVGTFDQNLKHYNKNTKSFKLYKNTTKAVKTIYEDLKGNLWLGSIYMRLMVLNLATNKITQIPAVKNDIINSLYEDRTGILWIGTSFRGTFAFDHNNNRFKRYLDDSLNPNVVMSIIEDRDGTLWIGTYGNGLKHFNKKRDQVKTYRHNPNDPASISSDKIFSLCLTSDGTLWVGTIGGGLNYFNRSTGVFNKYTQQSPVNSKSLSNNDITALYETTKGSLLIGNVMGGVDILDIKNRSFRHYYSEKKVPNSIGGGRSVTVFHEDKKSIIWAGTLDGLKRLDPKLNSFTNYNLSDQLVNKNTNNKSITSLLFADNIIWIGTARDGLLKFNPSSNSIDSYTSNNGLPDNIVLGILPDNAGNLWLSTNNGISRFNTKSEVFKNYDFNDGLQAKEFNQGAYFKSRKGEMFFGGINGFNSFYPDAIKDNKNIPPVYLTSFKVFDKILKLPKALTSMKKITLSYSQNFFSFEFVALNYTAPFKNKYSYYLKGFDKAWHTVTAKQRYASYTNLDPGNYILNVKASNDDGIWNEKGTSISIIITPPFWMTWWFRILVILLVLGTIIFIYKYRVNQILKIERMRVGIAADLHDEIGSSLGSIVLRSRILQNEESWTERSKEELGRIYHTSTQIASVMRDIVWFVNPDFDKLDDMILRMKDTVPALLGTLPYEFISPEEVLSTKLSLEFRRNIFLCYKEILHNITKHSKATQAEIKVYIQNGVFFLEISDNGVGFDADAYFNENNTKTSGYGLKNIMRRINAIGGHVKFGSLKGKGTKIIIKIKTT